MNDLQEFLQAARRRRWAHRIARHGAWGLLIGSSLGLLASAGCWLRMINEAPWWVGLAMAGGLMAGMAAGLLRRPSLAETASAIDGRGRLKDRVRSALQFSTEKPLDEYRSLQIRDTERILQQQGISTLFPWRWPHAGSAAAAGMVLAILVSILVPKLPPAEATPRRSPAAIVAEAKELAGDIDRFDEMASALDSEEMKELVRTLRTMLSAMETEARTGEDAMAGLARMASEIESAAAQFDPLLLQQHMQELGESMQALDGFETTAEMLKQSLYERAAQAVQQFGLRIGQGQESMPASGGLVENRIGELAEEAGAAALHELGGALASLQEAIKKGSRGECQAALSRLGGVINKYGRRVKVGGAMRGLLARVAECKSGLAGYCVGCLGGGACKGGECRSKGLSLGLAQFGLSQSRSPSESAGTAAAMNLFENRTELSGNRFDAEVTGNVAGDGPSDVETETTADSRQKAARHYRQVYATYRKISEAVMTEETIPLAHRHIIRRYFELIHPSRIEAEDQVRDVKDITDRAEHTKPEEPSE